MDFFNILEIFVFLKKSDIVPGRSRCHIQVLPKILRVATLRRFSVYFCMGHHSFSVHSNNEDYFWN